MQVLMISPFRSNVLMISPFRSNDRFGFNGRKGLVKLIYNTSSVFFE